MTYLERLRRAETALAAHGVTRNQFGPLAYRLLWGLGLRVQPPLCAPFWHTAAIGGSILTAAFLGLCWPLVLRPRGVSFAVALPAMIAMGFSAGSAIAWHYRRMARFLRLPRWEDLANSCSAGTVIASRDLDLPDGGAVTVTIGKPEKSPDANDYCCPFQIIGLKKGKVGYAVGIDAVQALELVLELIGADLYTSDEARIGGLSWKGSTKKGDLGFPVPDVSRDLVPD